MASATVPTTLRGLLLHDPRFGVDNLDTTNTTATQAGGTPDQPTRSGKGYADLDAVGWAEPAAGYATRWAKVIKEGGFTPGPTAGRLAWGTTSATLTSNPHGHIPHKVITGFHWLKYEGASTYVQPHAIQLEDGSVLCAYIKVTAGAYAIECTRRTLEATSWATAVSITASSLIVYNTTDYRCGPSLLLIPGGRILCVYVDRVYGSGVVCLSMSYSDDSGATWTQGAIACSGTVLASGAIAIRKFRAVYHGGYITAMITTTVANYHFVSADLGASYTQIALTQIGYGVELLPFGGGTPAVVYATQPLPTLRFAKKAGAYGNYVTDPSFGTTLESNGLFSTNVDIWASSTAHIGACIDQTGTGYIAYRRDAVGAIGSRISLMRIPAEVGTDTTAGYNDSLLWETGTGLDTADADLYGCGDDVEGLSDFCLVPYRGNLLLLHGVDTVSAGAKTGSIGVIEMGGWSNQTWGRTTFAEYDDATRFGRSYLPYVTAVSVAGWTTNGATAIESLVSTGFQLSTAVAANRHFSMVGGGSYATPIVAYVRVNASSGGALTDDATAIKLRWSNGAGDLLVTLRLTATSARLRDDNGAANLGSDVTGLATEMRDWMIYMDGQNCRVYYRSPMGTDWTRSHNETPTNLGATANVVHRVAWGNINGTVGAASIWAFVGASLESNQMIDFSGGAGTLRGREASLLPIFLDNGVATRARGGPLYRGNTYQIPVRYDYAIDVLDPAVDASPRRGWRSTATTTCTINWDLDVSTSLLSPVIGLSLIRPLAQTVYLEASNNAWAATTTLATISCANGFTGLTGAVTGDWLTAGAGTSVGARTVAADELVGGYVIMESGGTTYVRKIAANSEGFWFDPATTAGRKLEIRLEGDVSTLPAAPTVHIVPPVVTTVVWSVTTAYRYWRLRFAALTQDAFSPGYLALGKAIIGPVAVFGRQYSRGRVVSLETNNRLTQRPDGARKAQQVGPVRRVVEFQWSVPTDSTDIFDGANPDYVTATASGPSPALRQDLMVVEGIIRRQKGSEIPVVYLPAMKYTAGSTTFLNAELQIYGRITSETVTRTSVVGNEATTEASTRGAVRIEEEV